MPGEKNSALLGLLKSCEDLHRQRISVLKDAESKVFNDTVDDILMNDAYLDLTSPPPPGANGR